MINRVQGFEGKKNRVGGVEGWRGRSGFEGSRFQGFGGSI